MLPFRIDPDALQELEEGIEYFDQTPPGRGGVFRETVYETILQICRFPKLGAVHSGEVRKRVISRFAYVVFYVVFEDHIWIVAIAAGKRRPNYWRNRLSNLPSTDTPIPDEPT